MTSVKIVQIGDIHFPDHCADRGPFDLKDDAVNAALVRAISTPALQTSMRELLAYCDRYSESIGAVLICGDLTSRGNPGGYTDCLDWLDRAMALSTAERWPHERVHAVPGNHDISRSYCDPAGVDLLAKFRPLMNAWEALKVPILPIPSLRQTDISIGQAGASVFSLNSCLGCQERRHLPNAIQAELKKLLDDYVATHGADASFALVGEQMDTPAFSDDDIAEVVRTISRLPKSAVPFVVAHHNILPQATPRVAIYTDVLNGGLVRNRFASCDRPVIYCHGHIHDDPVEILSIGGAERGKLVSVSAPEFADGFNVIELHYSEEDLPLGCTVHRYRTQRHLGIEPADSYRIPLHIPSAAAVYTRELVREVTKLAKPETQRFKEFAEQLRTATGVRHQQNTIANALLEADWLSLVVIDNRNDEPKHWQIRRASP